MPYNVAIVGGGIVGLATAYRLMQARPDLSITVLEKEDRVAAHQTGRNSGVVHSGVFYEPGSLKAQNCTQGKRELVDFCRAHDVDVEMCGKVVVAVNEQEVPELDRIQQKGEANGVACTRIGPERLRELEPHTRGVAALHVPGAGIVDYTGMAEALADEVRGAGHAIQTDTAVRDIHAGGERVTIATTSGRVQADYLVGCAGLYADRLAQLAGVEPGVTIVPFRGEYYELVPQARPLCRNLIYPVPDPAFPFLGVHFTRMVDGAVECGPSAVLAFAREGYRFETVNGRDLWETLTDPGFLRLSAKHWRKGLFEMAQSLSKRVYLHSAQHLIPSITMGDLQPAASGVRAQAVRPDGTLVDDFLFRETERMVHVVNAPSPAATAALTIGTQVVERLTERMDRAPVAA
jgi:L-2-hydroxyglutarate oxidase